MASGVAVNKKCIETFKSMVKTRDYGAVVLKLNDDCTEVNVDTTFPPTDGSPQGEWDSVTKELPENDCRYVIYDFVYEHQGAKKNRLIFLLWSPDTSKTRAKMLYASSQEGVVNKMEGIQRQIQCTDKDEIGYEVIAKQMAQHTASY